jgi:TP901 family phage tail tape measure protein
MADIEVAGLVTKLSLDDSELEQSMASLNRQMQLTKSQFKIAESGLTAFGRGSDNLKIKSDSLSKQLEIQGTKVAKLQQEFYDEEKAKERNTKQTHRMQMELNKAIAEYNRLDAQLRKTNQELAIQESKWTQVGNKLTATGTKLQKVGKGMEDTGKSLTRNVSVPLAAAGGLAIKTAIDYESAFAGVRKTVDATESQLASLSNGIRQMSKEIPASATAIAGVAESAGQLGIETDNILSFTRVMVDLGESTNLSADQAATALARLANITQMPQDQFDKLGSTIVALGNNLATTESEIVEMGLRIAGAGKQVGMSEAQILSFAGALSSVGIEAQAGGSAISKVMIDMQLAVEKGGGRLNEFAKVAGMSAQQFRKAFKDDAAGAIISFIQGLSTAEERGMSAIKILDDMEIKEVRLRDALLRAAGAGDLFSESIQIGTKAWAENTALSTEAAQRYETTASKLQILKNRAVDIGITTGQVLIPALIDALDAAEPLIKAIENGAKAFSEMDKETQQTIVRLLAMAVAAGPVLTIGGKITGAIGGIAKVAGTAAKAIGVKTATGSLTAATTAMGTSATTAAGGAGLLKGAIGGIVSPAGLAVAAIAALTYGGYKWYKSMQDDAIPTIREFGDEVSDSTKQAVNSFLDLYDQADASLKQLSWSGGKVTESMATTLTGNFNDMSNQIIASLEESRKEGVASLQRLFEESKTISEEEQQEMLQSLQDSYDKRIATTEEQNDRINEILQTASKERRELTAYEKNRINSIQEDMKNTAIQTMSDGELEQLAILERLKVESGAITARQAADVIKNSKHQKEETVKQAEQQYNDAVKQFIFMRDVTGELTAEQANKAIREAKRQYDEVVGYAEDMHQDVVEQALLQAGEHAEAVDKETGEVLSKWDIFKRNFTNNITKWYSQQVVAMGGSVPKAPKAPSSSSSKKSSSSSTGSYRIDRLAFDDGGVVPGRIGEPLLALVHGGETILPTHKPNYQQSQKLDLAGELTIKLVNDRGEVVQVVQKEIMDIFRRESRR